MQQLLVFLPRNALTQSLDFGEDGIGGGDILRPFDLILLKTSDGSTYHVASCNEFEGG
jgi:hypothetical protein